MAKLFYEDVEKEARECAADPKRQSDAPSEVQAAAELKLAAEAALANANRAALDALEKARRAYEAEANNGFPSVPPSVVQLLSPREPEAQESRVPEEPPVESNEEGQASLTSIISSEEQASLTSIISSELISSSEDLITDSVELVSSDVAEPIQAQEVAPGPKRIEQLKAEGEAIIARRMEIVATLSEIHERAAAAQAARIGQLMAEGEAVIARRMEIVAALSEIKISVAEPLAQLDDLLDTVEENAASAVSIESMDDFDGTVTSTRAIFEKFDKDKSGTLSAEELKEAAMAAGRPADDETIRDTISALDTNNDGVVSLEEFQAASREVAWWEKVY